VLDGNHLSLLIEEDVRSHYYGDTFGSLSLGAIPQAIGRRVSSRNHTLIGRPASDVA
jgi:hypothetical protein